MSIPRPLSLAMAPLALALAVDAGAQTRPLSSADVNHDCTVTMADVARVQVALGRRPGQAGFDPNADTNLDGVIDNIDLTFVVRNVGRQACNTPPVVPTIAASVAPAANAAGWHRDDVVVTFACTNTTSCPAPVNVIAEGVGQVIERTASGPGGSASARVTVNIDRTPPRLSAAWPVSVIPGQSLTIPVQATDANGVVRTSLYQGTTLLDERVAMPFRLSRTVPQNAQIGTPDTLDVYAEDPAGNAAALRQLLPIDVPDTSAPDVRLAAAPTAPPGASIPLTVSATDDRALARVLLTRMDAGTGTVGALALLLAGAPAGAQDRLVLASAQVVAAVAGPPTLKLAANGPLAFTRLPPPTEDGTAQVTVRLHGVSRVELSVTDGLSPFGVSTTAGEGYVDLSVSLGAPDVRLDVRQGRLPHEVEVVVIAH